MSGQLEEVTDRVAEIIRRVGKREEIEEEVARNVSFSNLVDELIPQDGPVREAAIKVVSTVLKNLEIESGSDQEIAIIEGIDFKSISTKLVDDPELSAALKSSIKGVIENWDSDTFNETVDEVFGLNDSATLTELLVKEIKEELDKVVADQVRASLENREASALDDDIVTEIERAVFTPVRITSCLDAQATEINKTVTQRILAAIEEIDPSEITNVVIENEAFKIAINDSVEKLVRSGKIERLVEETASSILSSENSALRTKLSDAVSNKLVGRIADSVVSHLFERVR